MNHVTFDVAHQMYADNSDGLELWGRPGGEEDWTSLWAAYGPDLAVPGCYMWFWYDTGGELVWSTQEVAIPQEWSQGDVSEASFERAEGACAKLPTPLWRRIQMAP